MSIPERVKTNRVYLIRPEQQPWKTIVSSGDYQRSPLIYLKEKVVSQLDTPTEKPKDLRLLF